MRRSTSSSSFVRSPLKYLLNGPRASLTQSTCTLVGESAYVLPHNAHSRNLGLGNVTSGIATITQRAQCRRRIRRKGSARYAHSHGALNARVDACVGYRSLLCITYTYSIYICIHICIVYKVNNNKSMLQSRMTLSSRMFGTLHFLSVHTNESVQSVNRTLKERCVASL